MKADAKDRKIKRLQREVNRWEAVAKKNRELWIQAMGDTVVIWTPREATQECNMAHLGAFRAGDKISIRGKVTRVEETYCYENKQGTSRIEYMVEQTRRHHDPR